MKLLKLSCTNFMPYKGKIVLSFPAQASRNVMIIYGELGLLFLRKEIIGNSGFIVIKDF